jgi:hypothetical protein
LRAVARIVLELCLGQRILGLHVAGVLPRHARDCQVTVLPDAFPLAVRIPLEAGLSFRGLQFLDVSAAPAGGRVVGPEGGLADVQRSLVQRQRLCGSAQIR